MNQTGFVTIARNEGERLKTCLRSLAAAADPARVIYVDSGSTDGSVEFAHSLGIFVLSLDPSATFTMARARNAGFRHLVEKCPEVRYIQFLDGDCELVPGWLDKAVAFLDTHPDAAVVCGRRRERHPEKSVFNRLCDTEWNTPCGEARACGGDALMRRSDLEKIGGYNEDLIAGEEPEMCLRLRKAGRKIFRIDCEMTLHDANILRFSQWWRRNLRGGYGAADVADRTARAHGERLFGPLVDSARFWFAGVSAAVLLAIALAFAGWFPASAAILVLAFGFAGLQAARIAWGARRRAGGPRPAAEYGFFTMLAKLPQFLGVFRYAADRRARRAAKLIEYKQ